MVSYPFSFFNWAKWGSFKSAGSGKVQRALEYRYPAMAWMCVEAMQILLNDSNVCHCMLALR